MDPTSHHLADRMTRERRGLTPQSVRSRIFRAGQAHRGLRRQARMVALRATKIHRTYTSPSTTPASNNSSITTSEQPITPTA